MKSEFNRRTFMQRSLVTGGALFAIHAGNHKVLGANETIRVAITGINGRGRNHIDEFQEMENVEVVALIDPDSRLFASRGKQVVDKGGKQPQVYQDVRQAMESKDIDVLSIATTNHWHSLSTIYACQAGKDVYVEKPLSHNVFEGRIAVEAARKYNRIVQHGTQSRSSRGWAQLAEIAKQGTYGKLLVSRGLVYKRRDSIGFKPNEAPPQELAYDLWLGPAPEQAYNTNLVHYNWHWFWDFGNGDIGNQGVHQMDIARWMIPGATWPKSVLTLGGRLGYVDQGETPNTQLVIMDYGETKLIFEVRGLPTDHYLAEGKGNQCDNVLHFEAGVVANGKFYPKGDMSNPEDLPDVDVKMGPGGGHFQNFIEAVRSRKVEDLNADVLEGHYSAGLCHLANLSYRVGKPVPFHPRQAALKADTDLLETYERMEEHFKENKVSLEENAYLMGRKLVFDAENEQIVDDIQANDLLTRYYRKPFVVPDKASV
ncbi:MAG: Gfo/Idh/MocA family oxidoreductase [bacterium]|jgi:predicted dehydrogenase|nr:Gfo/Idh/MocA family oxidoreductase [bacterium]